ncbi:MAG: serine hydrolase domain-containing protein [Phycisphaerae bacterium]
MRHIMRMFAATIVLTAAALAQPASRSSASSVSQLLDEWRVRSGVPGATLAIARGDGSIEKFAVGVSRKSPETAMKPDDRMFSGSTGKTFVAAIALQLGEQGKLDLDATIAKTFGSGCLDKLPNRGAIALRHLLNHTSGLREHVLMPEFAARLKADPMKTWQPEELVAFVYDQPPLFEPGNGWSYADTNYIAAGMMIEHVTGKKLYDLVQERLLTPLKLADTIPSDRPELSGLISGYVGPNHPFPVTGEVATPGKYCLNPQFEWAGGGFVSTSGDLARWAQAIYGGDVLRPETRRAMLVGEKAKTGPNDQYGLGVQIWPSRHGQCLGHGGWFPGYVTQIAYYVDHKIAIVIQTNTDERAQAMKLRELLDDVLQSAIR